MVFLQVSFTLLQHLEGVELFAASCTHGTLCTAVTLLDLFFRYSCVMLHRILVLLNQFLFCTCTVCTVCRSQCQPEPRPTITGRWTSPSPPTRHTATFPGSPQTSTRPRKRFPRGRLSTHVHSATQASFRRLHGKVV